MIFKHLYADRSLACHSLRFRTCPGRQRNKGLSSLQLGVCLAHCGNNDDETHAPQVRERLGKLELNDEAVWKREHQRSLGEQAVTSPWWIKGAYLALCIGLDIIYAKRPIQRFWFLETVARMPYFSYISMLHLYESLGWWRAGAELRKVREACGCVSSALMSLVSHPPPSDIPEGSKSVPRPELMECLRYPGCIAMLPSLVLGLQGHYIYWI